MHIVVCCSRIGGARANAEALIKKGKEYEREMDVRAALRCYEVHISNVFVLQDPSWGRHSMGHSTQNLWRSICGFSRVANGGQIRCWSLFVADLLFDVFTPMGLPLVVVNVN